MLLYKVAVSGVSSSGNKNTLYLLVSPLEPLLQPKAPTLALSAPAVVPSIQQSSALY
jgi:hypothetical protein